MRESVDTVAITALTGSLLPTAADQMTQATVEVPIADALASRCIRTRPGGSPPDLWVRATENLGRGLPHPFTGSLHDLDRG